jgi:pectin methylesterase-like acyl-CoA thioesterase
VADIPAGFADGIDNAGVTPANIVWVAKSGGDFTSVSAALASITDASAMNPYLVKVAPGVYTDTATLKAYVDIEGSGEGVTILRGLGAASFVGTLNANGIIPAEVRTLTVESVTSSENVAIGIQINNTDGSLKFTHVTVTASGGANDTYGIYNYNASPTISDAIITAAGGSNTRAVFNQNASSPAMSNVSATASGGTTNVGVFNYSSASPVLTNVTANASGGTTSYGMANYFSSAPSIRESVFTGAARNIYNDGTSRTSYSPGNVIRVAPSGGDFTRISDALASITDASALNPYVIMIAPGTYTETVTMKQYVDIEGAGELMTKITQVGSGLEDTGTILGASNAELRFLTVENTGNNDFATAIYNSSASPRLTHITAMASGGGAAGGNRGIRNVLSSPILNNTTVLASGGAGDAVGIVNWQSSPTINNSIIGATDGTSNWGMYYSGVSGTSTVLVNNSQIIGSTSTIRSSTGFTTKISISQLSGGALSFSGGTVICIGVYDENYASAGYTTCP